MNKQKIAKLIINLRKEKEIPQDILCMGLCTQSAYSKMEKGKWMPDRLLVDALLQRMGKAPDKLAMILSAEEYRYFQWKKQVLTAVGQDDMDTLEEFLQKGEVIGKNVNLNLQKQFLHIMQAMIAEKKENNIKKSITLLEQAAELTMPGIGEQGIMERLVSVEEMHVLLEWSALMIKGERYEEALTLLFQIVAYAEEKYDDYEAKVKVYPRAVKLLYPLLLHQGKKEKAVDLCRKGVELLRWQGILYDMSELLEGYLICSEGFPETAERLRYEKQLQALKEVYEEYGAKDYGIENTRLTYSSQELYLIDELIKGNRLEKALSQETLSDGICFPETLSRIERGKRSPSTRNFRAIMEKLDTELEYYNGSLDTDSFLLLEKKRKLDRAMALRNWDEAQQLLGYLKRKVDMNKERNQRELSGIENGILFNTGELRPEEYVERCEQMLGYGKEGWREECFWKQFFTSEKMELLSSIMVAYGRMKRYEDGIFILEHQLAFFENSKVQLADRYQTSMTIIQNLSYQYGESGKLEKCLEMCKRGMKLCMESGRGVRMSVFLGNKAEAMNLLAKKPLEECKEYLRQAYYISDLMGDHSSRDYLDNYYRSNYDKDIIW